MKGLTMNEEPNIGRPYASRNRYDEFLPIPNTNAGGTHEQCFAREDGGISQNAQDNVHAEHNQEGSASNS